MKTHTRGNPTHGLYRTEDGKVNPLHKVWCEMHQRCGNPNSNSYKYYGARGITVSPEWNDFSTFHQWAIDNGYSHGLTIERKNNDGNYEPSNCIWIPRGQQRRNNRRVIKITNNGETKILSDWAKELGIKVITLYARIKKGYPIEMAFQKEVICDRKWKIETRKKRESYPKRIRGRFHKDLQPS
jgi:hypothetical protein